MTEEGWLACNDPDPMVESVTGRASDRKLRMFAVACCRAVWSEGWPGRCRQAVAVAEDFADGRASDAELARSRSLAAESAHTAVRHGSRGRALYPAARAFERVLFLAADAAKPRMASLVFPWEPWGGDVERVRRAGPGLLRDIVGNPFRPVTAQSSWLTLTVISLAAAIYEERAFDRLPILADALEEAGCDNNEVLAHCRAEGPHCRGCWVVALVLGKG